MGQLKDLTGQRFGHLTVLERAEKGKFSGAYWLCRCDCGAEKIIRGLTLKNGRTQSCGCLQKEVASQLCTKMRNKHGGHGSRLYRIWKNMHSRCYNANVGNYSYYGGRGITICNEWLNDFSAFRAWALSHGYQDDLTIDRIDVNGNYYPDNCRWVTMKEQNANQRPRTRKRKGAKYE